MSHPITNDHLQSGCATCTRRRAAEAVKEFSRSLSRLSETLNEGDKRDARRVSRTMGMRADELETGRSHLTCAACSEIETDAEAQYCKRCGAELQRIPEDQSTEDEILISRWSDRKKREGEKDGSQEAVAIFKANANLRD
jgi:hypothetical protein